MGFSRKVDITDADRLADCTTVLMESTSHQTLSLIHQLITYEVDQASTYLLSFSTYLLSIIYSFSELFSRSIYLSRYLFS